jgi:UDP-N-acetylmuramate dehydrogenase
MEQLGTLIGWADEHALPVLVVGSGSNLLVSDLGIRGVVAHLGAGFKNIRIAGECIFAGGAAITLKLVKESTGHGLSGLEGLAGVPGTVGGAVCMNAGTPAGSIGDSLVYITALDATNALCRVPSAELGLVYRGSDIRRMGVIVLEAAFILKECNAQDAGRIVDELLSKRHAGQPVGVKTAGSVFKNPEGGFAGRILDALGAKGMEVGGARVSPVHANFIENTGSATAEDIRQLIQKLQGLARERAGVVLETEIQMAGEWQ